MFLYKLHSAIMYYKTSSIRLFDAISLMLPRPVLLLFYICLLSLIPGNWTETTRTPRNSACGLIQMDLEVEDESSGQMVQCVNYDRSIPPDIDQFLVNWIEEAPGQMVFRKICIPDITSRQCGLLTTSWVIDVVPGWKMDYGRLTERSHVTSLQMCQHLCLTTQDFECKSATYNRKTRNCHLSRYNRRSASRYFVPAEGYVYFDNLCSTRVKTDCEYVPATGIAPIYSLAAARNVQNSVTCGKRCERITQFICRGYLYSNDSKLCKLLSEDTVSSKALPQNQQKSVDFMEKYVCIKVSITCTLVAMTVNFVLDKEFNGTVYAVEKPEGCRFIVNGEFVFNITIDIAEPDNNCGIETLGSNKVGTTLMLTFEDELQLSSDRTFEVMCVYENSSAPVFFGDVNPSTNTRPMSYSEETFLPKTSSRLASNPAPPILPLPSPLKRTPQAAMRIVNGKGTEVVSATFQDILYAEVTSQMKEDLNGVELGLFVSDCEAVNGAGHTEMLLDSAGCPTDESVFGRFEPVFGRLPRLRARFEGFQFDHNNKIKILCNVGFCETTCLPTVCYSEAKSWFESFGKRKKRDRLNQIFHMEKVGANIHITNSPEADSSHNLYANPPFKRKPWKTGSQESGAAMALTATCFSLAFIMLTLTFYLRWTIRPWIELDDQDN